MIDTLWGAFALALSLCMDCFAVTTCSSVTLRRLTAGRALYIGLIFSLVHVGFLTLGWVLGDLVAGYVEQIAQWICFLLLLYVGGSMLVQSFRNNLEVRDLNGLRNILPGAVATSIDAMAVGVSLSMSGEKPGPLAVKAAVLFVVTFVLVVTGVYSGHRIGRRFGNVAQGIGGVVLIFIGLDLLFGWI